MLFKSGFGSLRFWQQHGIHLVVKQHTQTDVQIVDLNLISIIFRLTAIDC
ncbi:Uncharacterised protein [Segatella copri]|nr:Uncharacterised protein [Segatella copri]